MMDKDIKLNEQGYADILKEIDVKEKQLQAFKKNRYDVAKNLSNEPSYLEIIRSTDSMIAALVFEIKMLKGQLENAIVIRNSDNQDAICIGDILKVKLVYNNGFDEEIIFKLVNSNPKMDGEMEEVSISSPLGEAVYQKKVGDCDSYIAGCNTISFEIIAKLILTKEDSNSPKLSLHKQSTKEI